MAEQNDELISLADMFPHIAEDAEQEDIPSTPTATESKTPTNKAAAELFSLYSESTVKDKKFNIRFQSSVFAQLQTICRKKGIPISAAVNMMVVDFINQNKDLLD